MTDSAYLKWCIALLLSPGLSGSSQGVEHPDEPIAFVQDHCMRCHNDRRHKGEVRLAPLTWSVNEGNVELWREVIHNLQTGQMPPDEEDHPPAEERQRFLKRAVAQLERFEEEAQIQVDPFVRLSNSQLAHSLQDLLKVSLSIEDRLIQDPIDPHGFSMQSELQLSGGYMQLYLEALEELILIALPDLGAKEPVYRITGNDWEKLPFHTKWDLATGRSGRKLYKGPRWLGDAFEIPLPPKHEYRMFLRENRPSGEFRLRLHLRNEPPTNGGKREPQELCVFLDEGFMRPYKVLQTVTVAAREGEQVIDLYGNLRDFQGVDTSPFVDDDRKEQTKSSWWRVLSIQNTNGLTGFALPRNDPERRERHGRCYLVRPEDQWIEAFGEEYAKENKLKASYAGTSAPHQPEMKLDAIYPEVMKTHGHVVIGSIEFEAPYSPTWPPPSAAPFLLDGKLDLGHSQAALTEFAARAWRRPLSNDEQTYLHQVHADEIQAGQGPLEAIRATLRTILCDPRFMYRSRSGTGEATGRHHQAAQLAMFLWDSTPDEALQAAALRPDSLTGKPLFELVDTMLSDPRSARFVESFTAHWIGFSQFDQIAVNPNYYGTWRASLKEHMRGECVAFMSKLIDENLSALNLIDSEFITINEPLAEHYGLDSDPATSPAGMRFTSVPAPAERGGVLTQAAVLLANSNGEDAHAVRRGVWLRGRLLGDPPSEPPAGLPTLADVPKEQFDNQSIKDSLASHRTRTCADCHKDIDPWGIAMEGFDAVGNPRESILRIPSQGKGKNRFPVVQDAEIGGEWIDGMQALKDYLLSHRQDEFTMGMCRYMLSHALGRALTHKDEPMLQMIHAEWHEAGLGMRSLIQGVTACSLIRAEGQHE